jgi:hypothetical protein
MADWAPIDVSEYVGLVAAEATSRAESRGYKVRLVDETWTAVPADLSYKRITLYSRDAVIWKAENV